MNFSTDEVIYISDKSNHCIRKVNLTSLVSSTYAGICGQPGFNDGPFGKNLFNNPDFLGVDVFGNLYVYDQGNDYIRLIETNRKDIPLLSHLYRICKDDVERVM